MSPDVSVVVSRSDLLSALTAIGPAVTKAVLPVLHHVKLSASDGRLYVAGTNLELVMQAKLAATTEDATELVTLVPLAPLREILRRLQPEPVTLTRRANKLHLKSGSVKGSLHVLDPVEWPKTQVLQFTDETVPWLPLATALKQVIEVVRPDDPKDALKGVSWKNVLNAQGVPVTELAGTNRHLLVVATLNLATPVEHAVLPLPGVQAALGLFDGCKEIHVGFDGTGMIGFTNGLDRWLDMRLIGEPYPDYPRMIPSGLPNSLLFSRNQFRLAIQRVMAVSTKLTRVAKIMLHLDDTMTVSAASKDLGEASDEVKTSGYDGLEHTIFCDADYLLALMDSCPSESVRLSVQPNSRKPFTFTPHPAPVDPAPHWIAVATPRAEPTS